MGEVELVTIAPGNIFLNKVVCPLAVAVIGVSTHPVVLFSILVSIIELPIAAAVPVKMISFFVHEVCCVVPVFTSVVYTIVFFI